MKVDFTIQFDERAMEYHSPTIPVESASFVRENLNVEIHGNSFAAQYHQGPILPPNSSTPLPTTIGCGEVENIGNWSTLRMPRSYDSHVLSTSPEMYKTPGDKFENQMLGNLYQQGSERGYHTYYAHTPVGGDFRSFLDYDGSAAILHDGAVSPDIYRPAARLDFQSSMVTANTANARPRFGDMLDHSVKEVEAAGNAIDNLGYSFSNDIKNIFNNLTARLQQSNQQFLNEEENSLKGIQALECELAETKAMVDSQKKIAAAKDKLVETLTQTLAHEKQKMETLRRCGEQKVEEHIINHQKFQEHVAQHIYTRKLLQRVFNALKKTAQESNRSRWEAACMQRAEEVCCQLRDKFHHTQEQLGLEMERLQQEKNILQKDKGEYETAVQQALMRGLCSLNMEALKVIKVDKDGCQYQQSQPGTMGMSDSKTTATTQAPGEPVLKHPLLVKESPQVSTGGNVTVPFPHVLCNYSLTTTNNNP